MDRIIISELRARCLLGVSEEERRENQEVVINISLYTDLSKAAKSDRLEDAVDYRAIKKHVLSAVEDSRFQLVEALTERVAAICLEHQGVQRATVRVEKPSALRFARSVAAEVTRERRP